MENNKFESIIAIIMFILSIVITICLFSDGIQRMSFMKAGKKATVVEVTTDNIKVAYGNNYGDPTIYELKRYKILNLQTGDTIYIKINDKNKAIYYFPPFKLFNNDKEKWIIMFASAIILFILGIIETVKNEKRVKNRYNSKRT